MVEDAGSLRCALGCWMMGAFFGFIAMMMLAIVGEFSWPGAVFSGGLVFAVSGLGISALVCRPMPRMAHIEAMRNVTPVSYAAATPAHAPTPAPVAVHAAPVTHERPIAPDGRPELLTAARDGKPDDLKAIKGVGPKLEAMLHRMGVFHFDQVASWRAPEVAWVDENLEGFKGRVSRDHWVDQAKVLAAGGSTEFSQRVEKGDVY
jgi:predicted flap endonuclease-1-like 5' DNA nuclease